MNEFDLIKTVALSAPNFVGLVLAVAALMKVSNRLMDLIERCDCVSKDETTEAPAGDAGGPSGNDAS